MLSFKPNFSLSSFTFIKRLFSSSLSTIKVMSSAYLRLLIFLLEILIQACAGAGSLSIVDIWTYLICQGPMYNLCLIFKSMNGWIDGGYMCG